MATARRVSGPLALVILVVYVLLIGSIVQRQVQRQQILRRSSPRKGILGRLRR